MASSSSAGRSINVDMARLTASLLNRHNRAVSRQVAFDRRHPRRANQRGTRTEPGENYSTAGRAAERSLLIFGPILRSHNRSSARDSTASRIVDCPTDALHLDTGNIDTIAVGKRSSILLNVPDNILSCGADAAVGENCVHLGKKAWNNTVDNMGNTQETSLELRRCLCAVRLFILYGRRCNG